jgi:TRAP-type uncharacterized transport system substrate-binding protein
MTILQKGGDVLGDFDTKVVRMMSASRSSPLSRGRFAVTAVLVGGMVAGAAGAQTLAERANRGLVELMTGDDGASIEMAQDLASVIDDGATRRVLPVLGQGGVPAVIDLRALRGVDMSIVQTDVLDYAKQHGAVPGLESAVTYVTKLHLVEFHLLARPEIHAIEDLAGKKVGFAGGATVTGQAVFDLVHVKIMPVLDNPLGTLEKLKSGEVDAVALVAAKPAPLFDVLRGSKGLHFIAIQIQPALLASYVPARLTAEDYPGLVPAGQAIDTIAVGTVLVAATLPPNTERYRNMANFVDAFFTQFPRLQESQFHPKWREVNLTAEFPGWRRFAPAEAWLQRNAVAPTAALDDKELQSVFGKFLDERAKLSGGQPLPTQEKEQLFKQFRQWQSSPTR